MEERNYLKIVWIVAFAAFAGVSCWATAESFHLLLPSWPVAMCWIVTIGFFIIASFGTKMIVDSLNPNVYVDKRGTLLVMGVLITLVFWLICSMPTNTHTLFYHSVINDMVSTDIATTRGYLGQVENNTNNKTQAALKVDALENEIEVLLGELEAEIKNEANPGFGEKSKEILRKFAPLLGVSKVEPLTYTSTTKSGREKLCDAYRAKIYTLAKSRATVIMKNILEPSPENLKMVKRDMENLNRVQKAVTDGTLDLMRAKDILEVCDKLNVAYNTVKQNRDFVNFASKADEEAYTADTPVTRVKRMVSVVDVWKDFVKGEYKGRGFVFWVVISVLIDVAAFVFFDLAFKKVED